MSDFKIPKNIRIKMNHAMQMVKKHADLVAEIDQWFYANGFDVHEMRVGDRASYTDCVDYGFADVEDVEKGINEEWEFIRNDRL